MDNEQTIQQRFEKFHAANPIVMQVLVQLAEVVRQKGKKRIGVKMPWERVRWEFDVVLSTSELFKLNNNFHSRYVRKLIEDHPEFNGYFQLRKLRAR